MSGKQQPSIKNYTLKPASGWRQAGQFPGRGIRFEENASAQPTVIREIRWRREFSMARDAGN
jgi:hypothetical protein